ncbi:hypothetical protein HQ590_09515 [bacterium]|nr:hypothetical protein [bacterium]
MNSGRAGLLALVWIAVVGQAGAQLAVRLRLEQENLLLYEPIRATVVLRGTSARPVDLAGVGEESWLSFLVTDGNSRTVAALGGDVPEAPLRVDPGRVVQRTLDLLPRYDIRARGSYRIQAVVRVAGRSIFSSPQPITVLHGTELWSDTAALLGAEPGREDTRTYSLVNKRERNHEVLYAGIRDPEHDLIYGMVRLGPYVPMAAPQALVDPQGRVHILFRHAPSALAYICLDAQAQVVDRGVYSDLMSVPRLKIDDEGEVTVTGGLRLQSGQRAPGPADLLPPAEKPALPKKPWWQFWKRNPAPASR